MHDHDDDHDDHDGWWFDDDQNCWRSKVGDGTIEIELYEDELNEHPIVRNLRALLASAAEHVPASAHDAAAIRHAVAGTSALPNGAAPLNDTRVDDARVWVAANLPTGVVCPVCTQTARAYRRSINSGMAVALLTMHAHAGLDWCHKPTVLRGVGSSARDESLLRYWGLIEEATDITRPDGGRAGWWRVTEAGAAWATGISHQPRYVDVFNSRPLAPPYGPLISIDDALGDRFDRRALLEAIAAHPG